MPHKTITFAHSPDPDDAFMFYGFHCGKVSIPGYRIRHVIKDIETLNKRALQSRYDVTAISAASYPAVAKDYWILSVGTSMGRRYGPSIVCRPETACKLRSSDWNGLRIAVPGRFTTANLLLRLYRKNFKSIETRFDKILSLVKKGAVDGGLIIHEGQLTYKQMGLSRAVDLGEWWYRKTGLPIPLGLDIIKKKLGRPLAEQVARAFLESIRCAMAHPREAMKYALKFGRGIGTKTGTRFVRMYVNKDTLYLDEEGRKSLKTLYASARKAGFLKKSVSLEFIDPV
ncbi:MAG TPA: ABC transporter substrate-binding protein [Elusimicrobiota bacterium]|nr:ABC transporter substrate-binding protein [Elusimicrobiota bacterium]